MNFRTITKNDFSSPKKPGRNLILEILIAFLVYACCSLGSLLIMIVLSERLLLPRIGQLSPPAVATDSIEMVASILALPELSLIMLFSTAATIVVVVLFCRLVQKRSWNSIGFCSKSAFHYYVRGVFFGGITISAAVLFCTITAAGHFETYKNTSVFMICLFLPAYLIQGASEEILCRGYFMYSVARRYPMWLAVLVSSAFFALMHLPNNGVSMIAFANLFLFGIFAALVTIRTGSIWYASGFHSAWNFFQGNIYGMKVSGMDMNSSLFHFVSRPAKAYLNGGNFGIEGGLVCSVILIVGILFLLHQIFQSPHISAENSDTE